MKPSFVIEDRFTTASVRSTTSYRACAMPVDPRSGEIGASPSSGYGDPVGRRSAAEKEGAAPLPVPPHSLAIDSDQNSVRYCSLPMKPSFVIADRLITASVRSTTSYRACGSGWKWSSGSGVMPAD